MKSQKEKITRKKKPAGGQIPSVDMKKYKSCCFKTIFLTKIFPKFNQT